MGSERPLPRERFVPHRQFDEPGGGNVFVAGLFW